MTKIAIMYTLAGGGHISLAAAAKEALQKSSANLNIELFDPFPITFSSTHKTLINHFLEVYRLGYEVTQNPQAESTILNLTDLAIKSKILKFCQSYHPDIIIANHPLIAAILPSVQSELSNHFHTVIHFADPFTTHHSWFFNKTADLYLSPTSQITNLAVSRGIPANKIRTIGWLLRSDFYTPLPPVNQAKNILGLHPQKFTVFLGGTGQGTAELLSICQNIANLPHDNLQVIVNTGLNSQIVEKIFKLTKSHSDLFHIIPYAHNIATLFHVSDVVIGKAGPNFLFEVLHLGRPLIVTSYLPGQESGNIKFIRQSGAGLVIQNPEILAKRIVAFSQKPHTLPPPLPTSSIKKFTPSNAPLKFCQSTLSVGHLVRISKSRPKLSPPSPLLLPNSPRYS